MYNRASLKGAGLDVKIMCFRMMNWNQQWMSNRDSVIFRQFTWKLSMNKVYTGEIVFVRITRWVLKRARFGKINH